MDFGSVIRNIRLNLNLRLSDVSQNTEIDIDYLSKIERNERPYTNEILQKLSEFYNIENQDLSFLSHICFVHQYLKQYERRNEVVEEIGRLFANPLYELQILKKYNITIQNKPRSNTLKYGKVKGFNFYIQRNGKLKKRERDELIRRSEHYYLETQNFLGNQSRMNLVQLDTNLTDDELLHQWNEFYDSYGIHFEEFRRQIERERKVSNEMTNKKQRRILKTKLDGLNDGSNSIEIDF